MKKSRLLTLLGAVLMCWITMGVTHAGDIPRILGADWSPDPGSAISKVPMGATCTSDDGGSTCTCSAGCWGNDTNCGCTQGKGVPLKMSKQAEKMASALKQGNFKKQKKSLVVGKTKLRAYKKGYLAPGMQPPIKSATCTSGDGNSSCDCTGFCVAGETSCRCGHKPSLKAGWGDGARILGPNEF